MGMIMSLAWLRSRPSARGATAAQDGFIVRGRHYKEGRVGMRWRVESEVIAGKGQFICGSVSCTSRDMLHSYEVPFSYREGGTPKQALVKVRVCPECCYRLHYKKGKVRCWPGRRAITSTRFRVDSSPWICGAGICEGSDAQAAGNGARAPGAHLASNR